MEGYSGGKGIGGGGGREISWYNYQHVRTSINQTI